MLIEGNNHVAPNKKQIHKEFNFSRDETLSTIINS